MRCLNCHQDGLPLNTQYCPNCNTYLPVLMRDILPPGTWLRGNDFQIEYALGRGGFGITYRAHQTGLTRSVAIKEFYPRDSCQRLPENFTISVAHNHKDMFDKWLTRFVREGRILAKLNHPNIVRVYDLIEERGTAYLVMELLEGGTLRQELYAQPAKKLPPQRVREIMEALVGALEAVHEEEVYHLDIKPENILVTPKGQVVLIDFGAAKLGTSATWSTRALSPAYAPPELINSQRIGAESDIFELGMVLHEMLAGALPEPAKRRQLGDSWQPAGLEEPWRSLVAAALPLDRDKRPKSVREWWNSAGFAPAVPSPAPAVPSPAPAVPPPAPAVLPPTVRLSPPAVLPPTVRLSPPAFELPPVAGLRGNFILPQLAQQGMVRRLGRGLIKNVIPLNQQLVLMCATGGAALFNMSSGEALWEIDCPANFGALSPDGTLLALGGARDIYLWDLRTGKFLRQLSGHENSVNSVAFSPNGKILASGSRDNTVRLWDVATGRQLQQLSGHKDSVYSVAFSPDGKILASRSGKTVQLWDAATGRELRQLSGHENSVESVAFSPDGKILASGSSDKTVRLWDVATGSELRQLSGHGSSVNSVAFSPDGKILASGNSDETVRLWDVATGSELRQLSGDLLGTVNSVAFSPDGKILASVIVDTFWAVNDTVRLWDVATGRELRQLSGHENSVSSVAFSPDGKILASGDYKSMGLWDVATGRKLPQLSERSRGVSSVAFSPDGKILASAHKKSFVLLWDVATGSMLQGFSEDDHFVISVAFSPDGKILASGGEGDNTVLLWDVATGGTLRRLSRHGNSVESVAFSPDGKILASGSRDDTV
ncbi:WD40 domain-containing protein [Kamptonema formosum]|uniref:WD40 domain-containing protein n=1 Tax=Kamptonema formosum TaxID=331992 RepID=UPI000345F947|nr:protein kinase [Oscillatoria sp. PCC 10802]